MPQTSAPTEPGAQQGRNRPAINLQPDCTRRGLVIQQYASHFAQWGFGPAHALTVPGAEIGSAQTVPITVPGPKYQYNHTATNRFGQAFPCRPGKSQAAEGRIPPRHSDATQDKSKTAAQSKSQHVHPLRADIPRRLLSLICTSVETPRPQRRAQCLTPPSPAAGLFWRRH